MKKYLKFAVMAAFALVTVYNVHKVQTEVVLSDTQLKNVEALASGEINPDCPNGCVEGEDGCTCFIYYINYSEAKWSPTE